MLDRFFLSGQAPYPLLWQQHDPWLVLLSVGIDIGACIVALHMAALARQANNPGIRRLALASGTLALGAGIWAMHFVGMLAFEVCARGDFDFLLTAASSLPSLLAAGAALPLLARQRLERPVLLASALLVASGIGAMHYLGMEASEVAPVLRYDPWWFAISIAVAVLLSVLSLWIRFGLRRWLRLKPQWTILLAGVVMGMAITSMHYTGMAAIRFVPQPTPDLGTAVAPEGAAPTTTTTTPLAGGSVLAWPLGEPPAVADTALRLTTQLQPLPQPTLTPQQRQAYAVLQGQDLVDEYKQYLLALAIAVVTAALFLMAIAANVGSRYRQLFFQAQASESRQRAVLETAVDAILMVNGQGFIQSANPATERLFGWAAKEMVGRHISRYIDTDWGRAPTTPANTIPGLGQVREIQALRRDDSLFPARLAMGRVQHDQERLYVGFITDLSQQKALERERERDAQRLKSLVSNLPGMTYRHSLVDTLQFEFVSDSAEDLTGWSAQDFYDGVVDWEALMNPDEYAYLLNQISYALQHDQTFQVEYRMQTRYGKHRWVSSTGRGVRDENGELHWVDGVIVDITESKAHSAEFFGIVEALNRSQASAEFTPHGDLLHANQQFLDMMGYDNLDELLGLSHAVFCTPEYADSPDWKQFWQGLAAGQFAAGEYVRIGKHGRQVWLHATYNPIQNAHGEVFKVVKFATDLTHRHVLEQDLRTAKEVAEAAAAARANFLANMSHEIRTPMNAIIGFTDALLDSSLDEQQRRHLGTVQQSARSLLRLLNDILDSAKLEKGAVTIEQATFDLRQLCQHTVDALSVNANKKNLQLNLQWAPGLSQYWQGDAFRLQQVLTNILGNAIKFTERGSVTLRVSGQSHGSASNLVLQIQDTGIGMDTATVARVFDAFSQADASTTRRYGGTGLGTTIARQLVELMGGRITVQSQPGIGTNFSIHLPLRSVAAPALESQLPASGQPGQPNGQSGGTTLKPLRILAVDDVPANLEVLQLALGRQGHHITQAHSGQQALELFTQLRFDLVLMDLQMPEMDGLKATQHLRAWELEHQRNPTPVIALSASVLEQDRTNARAAGMNGFANKPLELPQLLAEIARVLPLQVEQTMVPLPLVEPEPAEDQPAQAASGAPDAPEPVIDWQRGLRLWGEHAPMHAAIGRMLGDAPHTLAQLQAAIDQGDAASLASHAHRLRGAAANLALVQVQAIAEQIERAAQAAAPLTQAHATLSDCQVDICTQLLARVEQALATVRQAVDAEANAVATAPPLPAQSGPATGPAAAAFATPSLTPIQTETVQQALHQLVTALSQAELDEAALRTLEATLGSTAVQALRQALDQFDFDTAHAEVQALAAHTRK